jgi:hypothetical protein
MAHHTEIPGVRDHQSKAARPFPQDFAVLVGGFFIFRTPPGASDGIDI